MSGLRYVIVLLVAVLASAGTFALLTGSGAGWRAAFAIRDQTRPLLDASASSLRELRELDPRREPEYRAQFEEVIRLRGRLDVLEESRTAILRRSALMSLGSFVAALLAGMALLILAHRREQSRFREFQYILEQAVTQEKPVTSPLRGRDALARAASLVEKLSEQRERDRERLQSLASLESWQDHVRRVAHELRTPLAAALLRYRRLRDTQPESTEIAALEDDLGRLERMTSAMRSFAVLDAPAVKRVSVADMIREFADLFGDAWPQMRILASGDDAFVSADPALTRQVLANLADNAATAGATCLRITSRHIDESVRVTIVDDGRGVPETLRGSLFEPYVTARSADGGHGLGLAISRKIALDQEGDLRLVSSMPGLTEFELLFRKLS